MSAGWKERSQTGFLCGAITLSGGTLAAQLIPAAASPLLTRLYTTEDFGGYALFVAALGIFGAAACLKYDMAAVVVEEDREAAALFGCCLLGAGAISLLLLGFLPLAPKISAALGANDPRWCNLLPFGTFLLGTNAALTALALRTQRLKEITAAAVLRAGTVTFCQLILYPLRLGGFGLALSYLISYAASVARLAPTALLMLRKEPLNYDALRQAAARYHNYPRFTTAGALANALAGNVGSLLLSSIYSTSLLGCYSLVNRMFAIPFSLLSGPVSQLFLQRLSRKNQTKRVDLFLKVSGAMAVLAAVGCAGFWLMSPLIPVLFGEVWRPSSAMLQILLPLFAVRFAVSPVSAAAIVAGHQSTTMLWQFSMLGVSLWSGWLAGRSGWEIGKYLGWYSGGLACCYLIFYGYCLLILKKEEQHGE